jgi:hypothetical protein
MAKIVQVLTRPTFQEELKDEVEAQNFFLN